ncbi:MAG: hypothetical protein AAF661_04885 [Pseudomonadota bacterium]
MSEVIWRWRRPHIAWERGLIRWFGVVEIGYLTRERDRLHAINHASDPPRYYWSWKPLALKLYRYSDEDNGDLNIGLGLVEFFISSPIALPLGDPSQFGNSWGFSTGSDWHGIHLNWGGRCKILDWPWAWTHHSTEHRLADGSWWREPTPRKGKSVVCAMPNLEIHTLPYRYVPKNGTEQNVTATVRVERMTWRRRWLPWLKKSRTSINVNFDGEVGERVHDWKGGTTGCAYDMRPGETAEDSLRRMERDRTFN